MFLGKDYNITLDQRIIYSGDFIIGDNFIARKLYASRYSIYSRGYISLEDSDQSLLSCDKILKKIDDLFKKSISFEESNISPSYFDKDTIDWFLCRLLNKEPYILKWSVYEDIIEKALILFLSIKGELIFAISKGSLDDLIKTPSEEVKSASLEKSGSYLLWDTSRVVWITPEEVLSIIPQDLLFKELSKRCENYIRGVFRIPTEFLIHELQIRCKNN